MTMNVQAVIWLALLVVLLIIEAVTLGLTTIWFAGGSLAAFALAVAGVDTLLQIVVFCAVSVVLLFSPCRLRLNSSSGLFMLTLIPSDTEFTINELPPIVAPLPITVSPPSMDVPE